MGRKIIPEKIVEKRIEYKGFPCVVIFNEMGYRTGYVGVQKNCWVFGKNITDIADIRCHGGITYAEGCLFGQNDEELWWIGFDAAHCWNGIDYPALEKYYGAAIRKRYESVKFLHGCEVMSADDILADCIAIVEQILEEGR